MFCLLGIGFGTYSSIFIASATAYDFLRKEKEDKVTGKSSTDVELAK
jgi:SecD/SecF fusion protein